MESLSDIDTTTICFYQDNILFRKYQSLVTAFFTALKPHNLLMNIGPEREVVEAFVLGRMSWPRYCNSDPGMPRTVYLDTFGTASINQSLPHMGSLKGDSSSLSQLRALLRVMSRRNIGSALLRLVSGHYSIAD